MKKRSRFDFTIVYCPRDPICEVAMYRVGVRFGSQEFRETLMFDGIPDGMQVEREGKIYYCFKHALWRMQDNGTIVDSTPALTVGNGRGGHWVWRKAA